MVIGITSALLQKLVKLRVRLRLVLVPSRYLNSGYPGNRGIFPKAAHAHTINAMMHFLGFPERVVADDRRHKYEASGCGSHK